jgi:glycosyltransferase involved in cell wall biosynthesis
LSIRKTIIFYFPFRGVGGVSTLFLRLAREMSGTYDVYIADYSDGYMSKNIPKNVTLIPVDDNPKFPPDATIIFQAFLPWRFPFINEIGQNTKILFWGLHPKNFDPRIINSMNKNRVYALVANAVNLLAVSRKKKLAKFVRYLHSQNALLFQDRESIRSIKSMLSVDLQDVTFTPVPMPGVPLRKSELTQSVTTFAWIGRICDFKYTILIHVISRLALTSKLMGPIELLIVGEGEYLEQVKNVAFKLESDVYKITFLGIINENEIPYFLVDRVDFLFAMGTSAIEGARVGVPVLLTDYSYCAVKGTYKFNFFHVNSEFCLGEEISSKHFEATSSLETTIERARSDYAAESKRSFQYWEENFSLDMVLRKFECQLDETRATMQEAFTLGFFKSDFLGLVVRTAMAFFRPELKKESIGFRNDR